jgi:hypothetical protein
MQVEKLLNYRNGKNIVEEKQLKKDTNIFRITRKVDGLLLSVQGREKEGNL